MLGGMVAVTKAVQDYRITAAEVESIIGVMIVAVMMTAVMATLGKVTMKAAKVKMY